MSTVWTRYDFERAVFERIGFVAGLVEAFGVEGVAVDDQDAAGAEVAEVRGQRGRVHRHERVDRVAGRVDVRAREVDLETGDAGERAVRRANLGGKVGERGDVVADEGRRVGELRAGQLHAVARVAAEPDRGLVDFKSCFFYCGSSSGGHRRESILLQ